ncbi:RNA-binding S4 domain-containing protein [Agrobacterium salinitolerans]|uniref:RNA-binding S4 domain-containing protein n=1 Tax=Agrobacterium salinitolerans TaxID=1183413 RepID=UPI0022BC9B8D|nr:RNA-binding S4 domain-containing protein [Agrobacterium salinitolerans]
MGSSEQPLESTRQRLDKWLFFARMAKSRSLAQSYIQSGHVRVNGVAIRQPSHMLKAGDRLEIGFERMDKVLVVKSGGTRRGPYEEARLLYEDETPLREPSDSMTRLEQALRQPGSGRPTKKERRALDRFLSDSDGSKD